MIEAKRKFIKSIEAMLAQDEENNLVDSLAYRINIQDKDYFDEYISIIYTDGNVQTILATGNSNGENLKAVVKLVY